MQFERELSFIFILIFFISNSFAISAENSEYNITLFWNSFFGVHSTDIIATNPYTADVFSGSSYSGYLGPLHSASPVIFAQNPTSGASESAPLFLTCNVSDNLWLKNISFYGDFSSSWDLLGTETIEGQVDYAEYTLNSASPGTYTWNCYACDITGLCSWGNNYTLNLNVSIPNVILHKPSNGYNSANTTVDFECNASGSVNITQIKLQVWNATNSIYYQNTISMNTKNATGLFSSTFAPGNYSWNCIATNSNGYNSTANSNYTFSIFSSASPAIISAYASPEIIVNGSNEYFYISAFSADALWAEVTLPDTSAENVTLTNNVNTTYTNTNQIGAYNVLFFAMNSTTNQTVSTNDSFIVGEEFTYDLNVVDDAFSGIESRLEIYSGNSVYYNESKSDGIFSATVPESIYTVAISTYSGKSYVIFENFNITEEDSKYFGFGRDNSLEPNETLYSFNSSFKNYSTTFKIDYSGVTLPVAFYQCESFIFNESNCTGTWNSISASTSGNYAEISKAYLVSLGIKITHTQKKQDDNEKPKIKATVSGKCIEEPINFEVTSKGNPISAKITITPPRGSTDIIYSNDDGKATYKAKYEGKYSATFSKKGYISYDKSFSMMQCIECNKDNDCNVDETCSAGTCIKIPCSCGYYEEHKCINYECCSSSHCTSENKNICINHACVQCISNTDCAGDEICSNNQCKKIECSCGYAENHACVNYECCSNSECGTDQKCNIQEHKCEKYEIIIDAPKTADEGSEVTIQIIINGEPASNQNVVINGQTATTDEKGYVEIKQGYDDTIIEYNGEITKIESIKTLKYLDLIIPETEVFKDENILITLKDSKGNLVNGKIIITYPDGTVKIYDSVSSIKLKALLKGNYKISASAQGYKPVESQQVIAESCEILSIDYGKWNFIFSACWYWHVLVALIIIIIIFVGFLGGGLSYWIYKKSKKEHNETKKKYHGYKPNQKIKHPIEKIKHVLKMHHVKKYSFRR